MNVEMIEPTEQPATPEQQATQPTQGVFMDNLQAPNLVGIIMQALESHITALVDKRFNERMKEIEMPGWDMDDLKDTVTEMVDEKMSEIKDEINDMIDEKISDHQSEYDHDEYDQCVRDVENAGLDDIEAKIKDVMRGMTITLDL
jgi:hypothetical protein